MPFLLPPPGALAVGHNLMDLKSIELTPLL
jgi:hypothetical protein